MNHLEIVEKLIGPITPVGETNTDKERLENLNAMGGLVVSLIEQLKHVARNYEDAPEHSVKMIGKAARKHLDEIVHSIWTKLDLKTLK